MSGHTRKHFLIPNTIIDDVEKYKQEKGILTFSAAMLELLRIGIEAAKKTEKN